MYGYHENKVEITFYNSELSINNLNYFISFYLYISHNLFMWLQITVYTEISNSGQCILKWTAPLTI